MKFNGSTQLDLYFVSYKKFLIKAECFHVHLKSSAFLFPIRIKVFMVWDVSQINCWLLCSPYEKWNKRCIFTTVYDTVDGVSLPILHKNWCCPRGHSEAPCWCFIWWALHNFIRWHSLHQNSHKEKKKLNRKQQFPT